MSMKARITRELSKATSDKAELNKTVLKWKKHFDEAGKVIGADRKKKKYEELRMEKRFTSDNFETEVLKSDVPVLVDFYADWCGPCKRMAPIVEQLASEYEGKITVGKVNIDDSTDLAIKYGVMSIPTLIVFRRGEVFRKEVGVQTKATVAKAINQAI